MNLKMCMINRLVMICLLALLFGILAIPTTYAAEKTLDGHWNGASTQPAGALGIMVDFATEGASVKGRFDLPAAAAFQWPLRVGHAYPKVQFRLPTGLTFDGVLQGDTISGTVPSPTGGHTDPFYLKRNPAAPLPYQSEEVSFQSGGVTLAGTLRLPLTKGQHPAVFLLQGSGDVDREGESFYADHFTRNRAV